MEYDYAEHFNDDEKRYTQEEYDYLKKQIEEKEIYYEDIVDNLEYKIEQLKNTIKRLKKYANGVHYEE